MNYILILSIVFFTLNAQTSAKFRSLKQDENSTVSKTYDESTHDKDSSKWNTSDWNDFSKANGANTGAIGSMQNFWKEQTPSNVNEASNDSVQRNQNLSPNIKIWKQSNVDELSTATINNSSSASISVNNTVKCYIARDIPIQYECSKTGVTYGGFIQSNGQKALKMCESECYDQQKCLQNIAPTIKTENMNIVEVDNKNTIVEVEKEIKFSTNIDYISFDANVTSFKKIEAETKFRIFIQNNGNDMLINETLLSTGHYKFPLGFKTKQVSIILEQKDKNTTAILQNIKITHVSSGSFICPSKQDISLQNPGTYAYVCPSGKIKTMTIKGSTYKICEDYGIVGDNKDGTFSTAQGCNNICKKHYTCKKNVQIFNIDSLKQFREGCIEGQENCQLKTCPELRMKNSKILNEVVFDGTDKSYTTISSGKIQKGVYRPRPVLKTDVDFEERSAEEYKDEAFANMLKGKTYTFSKEKIGADTKPDSAYAITYSDSDSRSLDSSIFWLYKPNALAVNAKKENFYIVLEILTEEKKIIGSADKEKILNRILYVKTNENDNFKAFAVKKAARILRGGSYNTNPTAVWDYETFSSSSWYPIPDEDLLEYFKSDTISMNNAYLRLPVLLKSSCIYNSCIKGPVRSVTTNGPYTYPKYDGKYDATGEMISNFRVYAFTQDADIPMTYKKFIQEMDSGKIAPIYDAVSRSDYKKTINDDGDKNMGRKQSRDYSLKLFLYGQSKSKTAFTQIFPKPQDVGQKGYIFLFAF